MIKYVVTIISPINMVIPRILKAILFDAWSKPSHQLKQFL